MNKYVLRLLFVVIFVGVSSCKKNKLTKSNDNSDSIAFAHRKALLSKFNPADLQFDNLQMKAKVKYVNGKENQSFSASIRMKKDSIIWMSISPGMGIEAARCMITKDSVWMLDRINNKFYPYDFGIIAHLLKTNIDFSSLQAMMVGNLAVAKSDNDQVYESANQLQLSQSLAQAFLLKTMLELSNQKISRLDAVNEKANSKMMITYSEMIPVDTFSVPSVVAIAVDYKDEQQTSKNISIDIKYTKIELSEKALNYPFSVPKRFEEK